MMSSQHTLPPPPLSIHPVNTPCQHTLSIHPINTLSKHFIYHPPINPSYPCPFLLVRLVLCNIMADQHTLSKAQAKLKPSLRQWRVFVRKAKIRKRVQKKAAKRMRRKGFAAWKNAYELVSIACMTNMTLPPAYSPLAIDTYLLILRTFTFLRYTFPVIIHASS